MLLHLIGQKLDHLILVLTANFAFLSIVILPNFFSARSILQFVYLNVKLLFSLGLISLVLQKSHRLLSGEKSVKIGK